MNKVRKIVELQCNFNLKYYFTCERIEEGQKKYDVVVHCGIWSPGRITDHN